MAYGRGKTHTRKKAGGIGSKRKMAKGGLIRKKASNTPVKNTVKKVAKGVKKVVKKVTTKKPKSSKYGSSKNPRFL